MAENYLKKAEREGLLASLSFVYPEDKENLMKALEKVSEEKVFEVLNKITSLRRNQAAGVEIDEETRITVMKDKDGKISMITVQEIPFECSETINGVKILVTYHPEKVYGYTVSFPQLPRATQLVTVGHDRKDAKAMLKKVEELAKQTGDPKKVWDAINPMGILK